MKKKSGGVSEVELSRRELLATFATSGAVGVSGCLGSANTQDEQYGQDGTGTEEPIPLVPEVAWEFGTDGQIMSSPVPAGGMLFVTSYDGKLYALGDEDEDGIQHDEYSVFKADSTGTNTVDAGPSGDIVENWRFPTHGRVIQTPVVSDGNVFFGSEDNYFYSVSAKSGKENWSFNSDRVVAGASPAVVGDTVYVPTGNTTEMNENGVLYALDKKSGDEIWSTEFEGGLGAAPVVDDGRIYTGCQDNIYYALDSETGEELWSFEGDDVFCGSRAALMDGTVYAGSEDNSMYALDSDDGSLVWEFETGDIIVSSPVATEDAVYFGSNDDHLYAVDPDTGEEIWSFKAANSVFSSPAYRDGVVYVGCVGGEVYAINGQTGEEIWRLQSLSAYAINSSPVVTEDMVYFGMDDGSVYGIRNELVNEDEYDDEDTVLTIEGSV